MECTRVRQADGASKTKRLLRPPGRLQLIDWVYELRPSSLPLGEEGYRQVPRIARCSMRHPSRCGFVLPRLRISAAVLVAKVSTDMQDEMLCLSFFAKHRESSSVAALAGPHSERGGAVGQT